MRDVVKTDVKREHSSRRDRRRKKNVPLYFFLILIAALGIGVLLSVTLLFNIENIKVNGDVDYTPENVIEASGISIGDNLVRLDAKEAEQKILSSMVYIEEADISKEYPDTLIIDLVKCVPAASAEYTGGYLLISKKGKILDSVSEQPKDIPVIKGLEPDNTNLGEYLRSKINKKTEVYTQILEAVSKNTKNKVTFIDMTDEYSIVINYDGRIDFQLDSPVDIGYKIDLANTVLKDVGDKKGTMVMVGKNQISFRTEGNSSSGKNNKIPKDPNKQPVTKPSGEGNDMIDEDGDGIPDDEGDEAPVQDGEEPVQEDIIDEDGDGIPDDEGAYEEEPAQDFADSDGDGIPDEE